MSRNGHNPLSGSAIFLDNVSSQPVTTSGVRPSRRLGSTISSVQANNSLGRLTSASKLPASESSERRLVLEASSSRSPRRGSISGIMASLRTPAGS